ncbi:acyl-ACP--UDP-N- acetylglucosamine O-acyltransferase [Schumannella soli]|uniref:Acyl-ACP--UDP-N-acetylglucosamine O-acyltransferase n=1 Tax=Schumannella soli TaxID=2590779 RepID=A0A506Y4N3_9MICO|nr:acyl-ACP--UDP-N- acetylglucosamine O-acyltransferase [Schumannella soli]TPW75988.1 acyl-ACP--UDP-N- acetylglucosamine O-acyltransferase [Schumannella soli]
MSSSIHASAVIGDGVELGQDVTIGPGAVVLGPARIGDRVWIGALSVIGAPPEISSLRQNRAWAGELEHAGVVIEPDSVIREHVNVHQGSHRATTVGAASWLLNRSYIAHDVVLGEGVTLSAGVSVGGHCSIGAGANIGMNAAVHQRRLVGPGAMIGMGTPLSRDVPPFAMVFGAPPRLRRLNAHALGRRGISADAVSALADAYRQGDLELARVDGLGELAAEIDWWSAHADRRPVAVDMEGPR